MNARELPQYRDVVRNLTPILDDLPGKLIAIDGRSGVGKTTLGRYLSWRFNISLVESDLFLIPNQGRLIYLNEAISLAIKSRIETPRPVIVDGVAVRRLLDELTFKPNYVIYVSSDDAPESSSLRNEIASYEAVYDPKASANLAIDIAIPL
ncbi:MAG: hypothetical protein PS018_01885 [bacterium]|nr:hypothetical protein [bacterium]